jgi:hypothetical protein
MFLMEKITQSLLNAYLQGDNMAYADNGYGLPGKKIVDFTGR